MTEFPLFVLSANAVSFHVLSFPVTNKLGPALSKLSLVVALSFEYTSDASAELALRMIL